MFKRILVPLDGSNLAECALDYAEIIAGNCGTAEVILLSVTERVVGSTNAPETQERYRASDDAGLSGGFGTEIKITYGKKENQALKYLGRVAKKLKSKGILTIEEVLIGNPAEEITKFVEKKGVDMVVMASHGRSGPSRWTHGSVAEKVFRSVCVPILMIHPPSCVPRL